MTLTPITHSIPANSRGALFDLDKTLAKSKESITEEMAALLVQVMNKIPISVISGGKEQQFHQQLLPLLWEQPAFQAERLTLQPTSGGMMCRYQDGEWQRVYDHSIPEADAKRIAEAINIAVSQASEEIDLELLDEPYGEQIEYRDAQVTCSLLGQSAPGDVKAPWDPDVEKRQLILSHLRPLLPAGYTASYGGGTSIDVVTKGIDKAYGTREFHKRVIQAGELKELVYVGDDLEEGGNDAAARTTGVVCVGVSDPDDTARKLKDYLEAH